MPSRNSDTLVQFKKINNSTLETGVYKENWHIRHNHTYITVRSKEQAVQWFMTWCHCVVGFNFTSGQKNPL